MQIRTNLLLIQHIDHGYNFLLFSPSLIIYEFLSVNTGDIKVLSGKCITMNVSVENMSSQLDINPYSKCRSTLE